MGKNNSVSPSTYFMYKKCAALYDYKKNKGLKEPEATSGPLKRGVDIHLLAENYVKGKILKMPKELKLFRGLFNQNKKRYKEKLADVELEIALTEDLRVTKWKSPDTWLRVKLDFINMQHDDFTIIDYKTGKRMDNADDQLEIYKFVGFHLWDVEEIKTSIWYLDQGWKKPGGGVASEYERLKSKWLTNFYNMLEAKRYPATPNKDCKWCFANKINGGPCKKGAS